MKTLTCRRLSPSEPSDVADFQQVFRGTPSYTFATAGKLPTDAEVDAMMHTMPSGHKAEDIFIYAISTNDQLCGCSFTVRGYPKPDVAYVVLLMLVESAQGKALGVHALRHIEGEARSWGCSSLAAVVDSQNGRALKFWLREGFVEQYRNDAHGFMGQAVAIEKNGL